MGNIPAGGGVIVTPDMMLEAQRAIENALVDAQTVANQYLSSHEDAAPGYAGTATTPPTPRRSGSRPT